MFSNFYYENRVIYGVMWKNSVETDRPQMTTWRMRMACCITNATPTHTYTHSKCAILSAFHGKNGFANALLCYNICKIPVLLTFIPSSTRIPKDFLFQFPIFQRWSRNFSLLDVDCSSQIRAWDGRKGQGRKRFGRPRNLGGRYY